MDPTSTFGYPYDPADGREDLSDSDVVLRVVRGGSFLYTSVRARAADRGGDRPVNRDDKIGFRVVVSRSRT